MRKMTVFSLTAWFLIFGSTASADTIYTWTDADGVKRYSNSQPPEDAQHVQTIEGIQYDPGRGDNRRQKYDRMVEASSQSADRHFKDQAEKKARKAESRQQQQLEAQAQHIGEERTRLQKEIDAIQGRALGPTFTVGMKENQIKQIQEKINQLESGTGN